MAVYSPKETMHRLGPSLGVVAIILEILGGIRVFNKQTCLNRSSCSLDNEQTNKQTVQRTNEQTNGPIKMKIYFFEFVKG
jgi:hypothetical protein